MPGVSGCTRGDYARVLFSFAREAQWAPGIPCALVTGGGKICSKTRADDAARSRRCVHENGILSAIISGMVRRTRPGISRFQVRFAPGMTASPSVQHALGFGA